MTLPIDTLSKSSQSRFGPWLIATLLFSNAMPKKLAVLLMALSGLGAVSQSAIAQVTINRDSNTGAVEVDRRAFDIRTGELFNSSGIPLPSELPEGTVEGQSINIDPDKLAPNSLDITTDYEFVERSFNEALGGNDGDDGLRYNLQRDSVRTETAFDLRYVPGNHAYGEGIQVTVFNADGSVRSQQQRFVRGDEITIGPDGQPLESSGRIEVEYGVDERVELRILNLSEDEQGEPDESGVYFTRNGQIIAEDIQGGGDNDFDDGEYVELEGGQGRGSAVETNTRESEDTENNETPLEPETRRDENVAEEEFTTVERDEDVTEEVIERGSIDTPDTLSTKLGHAVGMRTENDELLVYDRYSAAGQVRAGSDGLGATGQLRPLFSNPSAPPTLLNGSANFNPFVDDNEAGFAASVGITQFLSRTHRRATDVFDAPIENPDVDGTTPLEPTGLFNNRRMVGYVSSEPSPEDEILSSNGIFMLPANRKVIVSPPNAQSVGPGDAAYTDNVGGFLLEGVGGALTFIPQWTNEGYAQAPITLEKGEATRIVYALVPQQAGQNLRLGQTYAVDSSAGGYRISDGGFTVISADQFPENFVQEMAEVYTVEDTLPTISNAATTTFNGVRGVYVEPDGGRLPTVDPDIPAEADARVGNILFPEIVGQRPYARTTVAAGLYLGGSLTGGVGNQQDITREIRSTIETETDQMRTTRTVNTFSTPLTQVESTTFQTVSTVERDGDAEFRIDDNGRLQEVKFNPTSEERVVDSNRNPISNEDRVDRGEETLIDTDVAETVTVLGARSDIVERDESSSSDSYANASPVSGEIALGGVLNFGNTPWTPAANVVRAELFARDTVIGRGGDGSETGWRAELMMHPFGEQKREAYQYAENGDVVAVYKTEPELDASGNQMMDMLTGPDGDTVEMARNQFLLDENGEPVPEKVGTGRPKGPGVYVRVEDAWDDGDSAVVDGGIQFSF